jgi:dTDP-4-amino-4,6-dideoxygalactose transaminase
MTLVLNKGKGAPARRYAARTIPFGKPWLTEEDRQAVLEVLQGPLLTHGPQGQGFEEDFARFLGDGYCVAVSSCMAALHLAYLQMGIGAGDEVIVPAQTHVATAHAVELVGARPVFVDCQPGSGNIDCAKIASLITPRTKALSLVHFLGIPCAMAEILDVAEHHGLKVVEDCALAVGTRYQGKSAGLFGDAGCFSFYPVKHITTGEGGMFVTRHRHVAEVVARLRAFGVDRSHTERTLPGMYDVVAPGLNYRMSELQAALGRQQLARIGENLERRRANFTRLKSRLAAVDNVRVLDVPAGGVPLPSAEAGNAAGRPPASASSHYCLSVVLTGSLQGHRDQVVARLKQAGIGTSVYYPQPVPRMTYYKNKYGFQAEAYANATAISDQSVALPVGPHLTPADMEYIAESFQQAIDLS